MEPTVLTNKDEFPTQEIIYSHIGKSRKHWDSLFEFIQSDHPEFDGQWNFYNDGKSWLMKMVRKSKTIFWLSVFKNGFRITFYFGDKAEEMIYASSLSDELKDQFKNGKRYGKIRELTLKMKSKQNIEFAKELISIKLKLK